MARHPDYEYKSTYCDRLVKFMARGRSYTAFAAHIGVTRETLYYWQEIYPDFAAATKLAFAKCQAWWEELGISGVIGMPEITMTDENGNQKLVHLKGFSATTWIYNMKCRFKQDWTELQKIEQTNINPPTIKVQLHDDTDEEQKPCTPEIQANTGDQQATPNTATT